MKVSSLGIVGTAKNTGKTTTLSVLLNECIRQGESIAVTGIGYDGETIDNLTFLPKPRLKIPEGVWVITSSQCLAATSARVKIELNTGLHTSLGEIQMAKVLKSGKIILAGPNQREYLQKVLDLLQEKGCQRILVDGSMGRIIPLTATQGLILATGAARNIHPETLAEETSAMIQIFSWQDIRSENPFPSTITLVDKIGELSSLPFASLLTKEDLDLIISSAPFKRIIIPGVISEELQKDLFEYLENHQSEILLYHPGILMLSHNIPRVVRLIKKFREKGGKIGYHHPLNIRAVTLNPFYPKRQTPQGLFEPAHVDRELLKKEFHKRIQIPIFDVLQDSSEKFHQVCLAI